MKKLLLVLVTGFAIGSIAFAQSQVSFSGQIGFRGDFAMGNNNKVGENGAHAVTRDWFYQGRLALDVNNGNGTAGGTVRMWVQPGGGGQ